MPHSSTACTQTPTCRGPATLCLQYLTVAPLMIHSLRRYIGRKEIFLPRDDICVSHRTVSVRLSVCIYGTFVHCVDTNTHIFNYFFTIGQPHHYSFSIRYQTLWLYSDGDSHNGASICRCDSGQIAGDRSIDDCCCVRSIIDGQRCRSVPRLRYTSVYGTETVTHQ